MANGNDLPQGMQRQKIAFVNFLIPAPYAPGHTIDQDEADALNAAYGARLAQLSANDIKDKFASEKSKGDGKDIEWVDGWSAERAQTDIVDQVLSEFTWSSERTKKDPVEVEMYRLAAQAVDRKLAEMNLKLDSADRRLKIKQVLAQHEKPLRKTAEKNVSTTLDVNLGLEEDQPQAA